MAGKITFTGYGEKLAPGGDGAPFTKTVMTTTVPRVGEHVVMASKKVGQTKTFVVNTVVHTVHTDGGMTTEVELGWSLEDLR